MTLGEFETIKSEALEIIARAEKGQISRDDLSEFVARINSLMPELKMEIDRLNTETDKLEDMLNSSAYDYIQKERYASAADDAKKRFKEADYLLNELEELKSEIAKHIIPKKFNKNQCFSNIRELLKKNPSVKIGQIEKEADVQPGYMSRLAKDDNKTEPSVEFIVTAAKLLKVSVDALISSNMAEQSETEKYVSNFIEKLTDDTFEGKLNWNTRTKHYFDSLDVYGYESYPLFSVEEFVPEDKSRNYANEYVFLSKTHDVQTIIADDGYELRLKNGTWIHLMSIGRRGKPITDKTYLAKEIWATTSDNKKQFICSTNSNTYLSDLVEKLHAAVFEYSKHPQLDTDIKSSIDAFMLDDLEDDAQTYTELTDDDGELPF